MISQVLVLTRGLRRFLTPLRTWLVAQDIQNPQVARLICQLIPAQCPFERDIDLFGQVIHIPAMCELNPLYDEFVQLRFQSLMYLADHCGEDVTKYCH